ncbi:MAG: histone acetylation protein-domain-containing protein [Linnemannia gamsii]|nr:MAG: histone acetylation protein-domain-containing protein [Linnemannia gamsii]
MISSYDPSPMSCTPLSTNAHNLIISNQIPQVLMYRASADRKDIDGDKDADTEADNKASHVLIAGLEVLEYTLTPLSPTPTQPSGNNKSFPPPPPQEERIIYIAKVDTSGYWPLPGLETSSLRGRSPAQALVKGYLRSVRATSHGPSALPLADVTNSHSNSATAAAKMSALSITAASASASSSPPVTTTMTRSTTPTRSLRPQKTSLYIFARAQPQYLFAESAKNPRKRVLDDRGLVRWWKNTAASVYAEDVLASQSQEKEQEKEKDGQTTPGSSNSRRRMKGGKTKVQGWWHIPGIETDRQAHNVIQSPSPTASTTGTSTPPKFEWTYGYPDKDSKELANALIPQFPDDPKSRMMQSPSCQGGFVNIQTFWELAAIGEESGAGKITGFFRVVEEAVDSEEEEEDELEAVEAKDEGDKKERVLQEEEGSKSVTGTTAGYTKAINFLLDLDFSTLEAAKRSTVAWQERVGLWIRKANEREVEHALEVRKGQQQQEEGKEEEEEEEEEVKEVRKEVTVARPLWIQKGTVAIFLRTGLESSVVQEPTTSATAVVVAESVSAPASAPVVVNTLNMGLIKRKTPTTPATATPSVNVLGIGLIKRKEPTPGPATLPSTANATATSTVNVLGAGLIKRKVVALTTATTTTASLETPVSTPPPVMNVLGAGLIKRKVAPTSTIIPTTTATNGSDSSSSHAAAPVVNVLGASFIKKRKTDS